MSHLLKYTLNNILKKPGTKKRLESGLGVSFPGYEQGKVRLNLCRWSDRPASPNYPSVQEIATVSGQLKELGYGNIKQVKREVILKSNHVGGVSCWGCVTLYCDLPQMTPLIPISSPPNYQ